MKVLKFGAVWCPDCIIMKPRWKELEKEHSWLETRYFDFDENKEEVEKYKVGPEIPCFIFLDKDEKELVRYSGDTSKKVLIEAINTYKDF